jgi:outer membrane autotransporter protein
MHDRFIILTTICFFWIHPIFADFVNTWTLGLFGSPSITPLPGVKESEKSAQSTENSNNNNATASLNQLSVETSSTPTDATPFKKTEIPTSSLPPVGMSSPTVEPLITKDLVEESHQPITNKSGLLKTKQVAAKKGGDAFEFTGARAIADWLNTINIEGFFDYASKYTLRNNQCFVVVDSFQNLSMWVEPYGFYARYRSPKKKVDLSLSSIGAGMGASYAFLDELHVGGGAGYFHSNLDETGDKATINGVYFGPSVVYLFSEGSIGFMVMGIGNFYDGERKIKTPAQSFKNIHYDEQSWDIDMRLEAEYDVSTPREFFIKDLTIHPYLRVDYLNVFEQGFRNKIDDKRSLDIEGRHSAFFYSKLAVRFEKVMFCNKTGFLTSNVDVGWINMTPLSSDAFAWKVHGSEKGKTTDLTTESKNQCALGLEFIGAYHNGLLIGLGYQAALGADSPMQTGRARIEWDW